MSGKAAHAGEASGPGRPSIKKEAEVVSTDSSGGKTLSSHDIPSQAERILEEGKVFFLYRPRVSVRAAHSVAQLQRFFMILQPEDPGRRKSRLVIIGKKRLPSAERHEKYFGFVAAVSEKLEDLLGELSPQDYTTKTQGDRHVEGARVAGEGHYALVVKHQNQTYLAWELEVPATPGEVQKDLRISKQGSLALSIKNPKNANRQIGLTEKAEFGEKQKLFGGYAWIPAEDPALLDFKNAELLFIGASTDLEGEFGKAFESHMLEKVKQDTQKAVHDAHGKEGGVDEDEEMLTELREELQTEHFQLEATPAAEKQWK